MSVFDVEEALIGDVGISLTDLALDEDLAIISSSRVPMLPESFWPTSLRKGGGVWLSADEGSRLKWENMVLSLLEDSAKGRGNKRGFQAIYVSPPIAGLLYVERPGHWIRAYWSADANHREALCCLEDRR